MAKLAYEAPRLTMHGSVSEMTQGASTGSFLDASFPVGTPVGDLTFENNPGGSPLT